MVETIATLSNEALAHYLAEYLSDLEFELLVRKRITLRFELASRKLPDLYEGTSTCSYQHSFTDQATWHIRIGENYTKSVSCDGEVLSTTMDDAIDTMRMRYRNKLSLLLPAPDPELDI